MIAVNRFLIKHKPLIKLKPISEIQRMGLKKLIPLFVLVVVVGILAFVGLVVYSIVEEVSTKAREKIEKKNILITKGGLKVGVKELRDEEYRDRSQKVLMSVWNHKSLPLPVSKTRLWGFWSGSSGPQNAEKRGKRR